MNADFWQCLPGLEMVIVEDVVAFLWHGPVLRGVRRCLGERRKSTKKQDKYRGAQCRRAVWLVIH